jgi:hypothetical protein
MTHGTKVKVFGSRVATVDAVSANGKRVHVTGDYTGWTRTDNCKAA